MYVYIQMIPTGTWNVKLKLQCRCRDFCNHITLSLIKLPLWKRCTKERWFLTGPLTCPGMLGHSDSTQLCGVRRTRGRTLFEPSGIHACLGQLPPADPLLKMFGAGKNPLPWRGRNNRRGALCSRARLGVKLDIQGRAAAQPNRDSGEGLAYR